MAVEVALNTPLAEALGSAVQTKLMDTGWASGGLDDSALVEYIILMLVNGKTQEQIATELSTDLLSLPPEDTAPADFAKWLFEQTELLNNRLNGIDVPQSIPDEVISDKQGTSIRGAALRGSGATNAGDAEMSEATDEYLNGAMYVEPHQDVPSSTLLMHSVSPTGPKSMRSGSRPGIGNRRMVGQLNRAMDRSGENALHRVRSHQGSERINMHNRPPPKGPRNEQVRGNRFQPNGRAVAGQNGTMNGNAANTMMNMNSQQQMQLMAMLEQQAQMMAQIMPQQMQGMFQPNAQHATEISGQHSGRSLFDRVEGRSHRPNGHQDGRHNGGFHKGAGFEANAGSDQQPTNGHLSSSMEIENLQAADNPAETVCKFNLKCTKKDCPFAHQSPAAPPGTTVDVHDICPFGAACKNKKCVGRHPSPFQKVAHASEQDCKFFPNCTNPTCPFRHPTMPMCRNGADCNRDGCKFTHVKIMCKYNPCLNSECVYKHAEGQKRGKYGDKVWTADQDQVHVSERKFVDDEMGDEELVRGQDGSAEDNGHGGSQHSAEVVT